MSEPSTSTPPAGEPWSSTALRTVVHAVTGAVLAWPVAVGEGVGAAAVGAGLGALSARWLGRSTVRLPIALGGLAVLFGLVVAARAGVTGSPAIASLLGAEGALRAGDVLLFGLGAFVVSMALRVLSLRRPPFAVLEAALVGVGFAGLLLSHRHGAIHRPYELADPLIARGDDPTLAILLIGAVGATVVGLLLLSERNLARSALHVGVVGAILLLILSTTAVVGVPVGDAAGGGLGLRDDEREERGGGSSGERAPDDLDFRDDFEAGANTTPVAVVLLRDDYAPPTGIYYFRQQARSRYGGRALLEALAPGIDEDDADFFPTRDGLEVADPPPLERRELIETTVALLADHGRPFGLEAPIAFRAESNPNPQRFRRLYSVRSAALAQSVDLLDLLERDVGAAEWSAATASHYREAPEDPRYGELAARILERLPEDLREDPAAQAYAIAQHLGQRGIYSLRTRHSAAEDPTASFLFGDLTGYCVHFAHAAVYLMRSIGLPARVATGYAVAESARQGGSAILLRSADAHAWPEVYVRSIGWVVVDVQPEQVLTPPPPPPDPQLQRLLGELARGMSPLGEESTPPRPLAETFRAGAQRWGVPTALWLGLRLLLLLVAAALVKAWRGLAPLALSGRARSVALYVATLDRLSELGLRRRYGESREGFAARVGDAVPALRGLTLDHLRLAFGSAEDPDVHARIADLGRRARAEARSVVPLWRRVLGLLNPFSWLLTR